MPAVRLASNQATQAFASESTDAFTNLGAWAAFSSRLPQQPP